MKKLIIYTDGGARNNPGPAGAGFQILEGEKLLFEGKQFLGSQTNNWAEYEAVALALHDAKARGLGGREIEVRMASKPDGEQILANWKIKEPSPKPQVAKVRALLAGFSKYHFVHVPREDNAEADRLVNEAIDSSR